MNLIVCLLTLLIPAVVSCGPDKDGFLHKAGSCRGCPQGHGEDWCGGDCQWMDGECADKLEMITTITEGRKKRETANREFNAANTTALTSTNKAMTYTRPLPAVDVFLNPARLSDMEEAEEYQLNMTR